MVLVCVLKWGIWYVEWFVEIFVLCWWGKCLMVMVWFLLEWCGLCNCCVLFDDILDKEDLLWVWWFDCFFDVFGWLCCLLFLWLCCLLLCWFMLMCLILLWKMVCCVLWCLRIICFLVWLVWICSCRVMILIW